MDKTLLAALTPTERHLVAETEPAALRELDEDEVLEVHQRIRRARSKYVGQYRRGASADVARAGGRGTSRPRQRDAATRAEAFEVALARVSRRLSRLAADEAAALKAERLAAAGAGGGSGPGAPAPGASARGSSGRASSREAATSADAPSLRTPARERERGATRAAGDRRQARRDSKG